MYRSPWSNPLESICTKILSFQDKPVGHAFSDIINTVRDLVWVKVKKNMYYLYNPSYMDKSGTEHSAEATDKTIKILDRAFFTSFVTTEAFGTVFGVSSGYRYTEDICKDSTGKKFIPFDNMIFSPYGELLNRVPVTYKNRLKEWDKSTKEHINRMARSRYHNTRATERLENAQLSGDWSEVIIMDTFKLWNVTHRRAIIDHFGMNNILDSFDKKTLDIDTIDGRPYELISINLPVSMNQDETASCLYLKMTNPSTGEYHFEGIPNISSRHRPWSPSIADNTVKAALAWRDNELEYQKPEVLT